APVQPDAMNLVLAGKVKLDHIGYGDIVREHQLGAVFGNVAHEAIDAGALVVIIDAPLQKALLARGVTSITHGSLIRFGDSRVTTSFCRSLKITAADYRIVHASLASSLLLRRKDPRTRDDGARGGPQ